MPCRWAAWCVLGLFLLAGCQRAGEPEAAPTPEVEARTETRERQPFTLLATGDNRGQIAPCGCEPPVGGLSRRVVYVRKRREEGPVLVVDAGDALAEDGRADPERARLILRAMAATGIEAAAVGELDLALGVAWLREEAAKAGVPYLAANLRSREGASLFPGRRIVEVGGNRVGVFAVLATDRRLPDEIVLGDPVEAARGEVRALRSEGVDLVVGLVHGPMREVHRLAREVEVDLVVPAHQGGNTDVYPSGGAWIAYAGSIGRSMLEAKIDLRGEGRLVATGFLERLRAREEELERTIEQGNARLASAPPSSARREIEERVAGAQRQIERVRTQREELRAGSSRTLESRFVHLVEKVGEDPEILEAIQRLEAR